MVPSFLGDASPPLPEKSRDLDFRSLSRCFQADFSRSILISFSQEYKGEEDECNRCL